MAGKKFYPSVENLGKNCEFWQGVDIEGKRTMGRLAIGCQFPKAEMEGRLSCEGIIDDVCLYLKNGRRPRSLTEEQIFEIKTRIPGTNNRDLPPGNTY